MSKKNIKYLLASLAALSSSSGALTFAQEQQNFVPGYYQQLPPEAFYQNQMYYPQQMGQYSQQMGQYPQQMGQYSQQMGQYPQQMGQSTQQMGQYPQQVDQSTQLMGQNPQQMNPAPALPGSKNNDKQSVIKDAALNVQKAQQKQKVTNEKQQTAMSGGKVPMKNMNAMSPAVVTQTNSKKGSVLKPILAVSGVGALGIAGYKWWKDRKSGDSPLSPEENVKENLRKAADVIWNHVKEWLEHNKVYLNYYNERPESLTEERILEMIVRWGHGYIKDKYDLDELGYDGWLVENNKSDAEESRSEFFYKKAQERAIEDVDGDFGMIFASSKEWLNKEYYTDGDFDPKKSLILHDESGLMMTSGKDELTISICPDDPKTKKRPFAMSWKSETID